MTHRLWVGYGHPEDPASFDRDYTETHVPMGNRLPGVRRYTIGWARSLDGQKPPFHLVAELDFDSAEALSEAVSSEAGQAAIAHAASIATGGFTVMVFEVEDVTSP